MAAPCGGPGPSPAAAAAAAAPGPNAGAGPRVCFAAGAAAEAPEEAPGRRQGKVTVRYDRRELRKRLHLEEWILAQLTALYDCRVPGTLRPRPGPANGTGDPLRPLPGPPLLEEEIPELDIDVDELLDMESDGARSARMQEILVDCYKPTEAFVGDLLEKIRGMQKLNTHQKK